MIGFELHIDLCFFPTAQIDTEKFKMALVVVDSCTSYVYARPIKNKQADHLSDTFFEILDSNCLSPKYITTDGESGLMSEIFQNKIDARNIIHRTIDVFYKNSNMAESTIHRVNSLLRRCVGDPRNWIKKLQQVIYALNVSLMRYAPGKDGLVSPAFLQNGRHPLIPDLGETVSNTELIKEINKARFTDVNNVVEAINKRVMFHKVEICLIHSEHVIGCRRIKNATRKYKLSSYWRVAKIIEVVVNYIIVELPDKNRRRVYKRQVRKIPPNKVDKFEKRFADDRKEWEGVDDEVDNMDD